MAPPQENGNSDNALSLQVTDEITAETVADDFIRWHHVAGFRDPSLRAQFDASHTVGGVALPLALSLLLGIVQTSSLLLARNTGAYPAPANAFTIRRITLIAAIATFGVNAVCIALVAVVPALQRFRTATHARYMWNVNHLIWGVILPLQDTANRLGRCIDAPDAVCPHVMIDGFEFNQLVVIMGGQPQFRDACALMLWTLFWKCMGRVAGAVGGYTGLSIFAPDVFFVILMGFIMWSLYRLEMGSLRRFVRKKVLQLNIVRSQQAQIQVNGMLVHILPAPILQKLLTNEPTAEESHASVLFSDVAGFTAWSSNHTAMDVVRMLNSMYCLFDEQVELYGVEKVTTIGDAYWAACGIPTPNTQHAAHLCSFGLFMLSVTERMRRKTKFSDISIRVGVHTGDVLGAVVGQQQMAFQLFGHTVEVAERLEQLAPVNGLLISTATLMSILSGPVTSDRLKLGDVAPAEGPDVPERRVLHSMSWLPEAVEQYRRHGGDGQSVASFSSARSSVVSSAKNTQRERELRKRLLAAQLSAEAGRDQDADDNEKDLSEVAEEMAQQKHYFRLMFKDEATEEAFTVFNEPIVKQDIRVHAGFQFGSWTLALLVLTAILGTVAPAPNPPAAWIIAAFAPVCCCLTAALQPRMPSWVGFALSYLTAALLLVSCFFFRYPSMMVADVTFSHVTLALLYFNMFCGSPAAIGWTWTFLFNVLAVVVHIVSFTVFRSFHLLLTVMLLLTAVPLSIMGVRRFEVARRSQFIDGLVAQLADERIAREIENTRALLERTMPSFVIGEVTTWLEQGRHGTIAHSYQNVGVMFAKAFNPVWSRHVDAHDAPMGMLMEELFGGMERIVARYDEALKHHAVHVVKVKTIGDIGMFACGLAAERSGVASDSQVAASMENSVTTTTTKEDVAVARAVEDMIAFAVRLTRDESPDSAALQIGLHVGPVVGGVLGSNRLIYDIFGDTVNTASRVASTAGAPGVWLSQQAVACVTELPPDAFAAAGFRIGVAQHRQMKGKGAVAIFPVESTA